MVYRCLVDTDDLIVFNYDKDLDCISIKIESPFDSSVVYLSKEQISKLIKDLLPLI